MESSLGMPQRDRSMDAWVWVGEAGAGMGGGSRSGAWSRREWPPDRTIKGFHSACSAFWNQEGFPFEIKVLTNGIYFFLMLFSRKRL